MPHTNFSNLVEIHNRHPVRFFAGEIAALMRRVAQACALRGHKLVRKCAAAPFAIISPTENTTLSRNRMTGQKDWPKSWNGESFGEEGKIMKKAILGIAAGGAIGLFALAAAAQSDRGGDRFDRLDTDKNGEISAAENAAADAKRQEWREKRATRRAERFAAADADGNGAVSREEMSAYREARRAERNPDKNGDGVVDRSEYLAQAEKRFDRQDKNGDGVLSEDEKRRGHGKKHRRHGRRGHGHG